MGGGKEDHRHRVRRPAWQPQSERTCVWVCTITKASQLSLKLDFEHHGACAPDEPGKFLPSLMLNL